jgi:tetratricopeptide (TPR) repeat protein
MSKWVSCVLFDRVITPRNRARALRLAGVGLLSCTAVAGAVAQERQLATREGSVLIAIRDATSSNSATSTTTPPAPSGDGGAALQPTSQFADRTPDLAESVQTAQGWKANHWQANSAAAAAQPADAAPSSAAGQPADESTHFGAALADVVRSQQKKSPPPQQLLEQSGGPAAVASARELVPYQPARFNRVQPGSTTLEQIKLAWGEPASSESTDEGVVLNYDIEPFAAVEVLISPQDVVTALKITLTDSLEPKTLTEQLALTEFEQVTITDNTQRALGIAFPERGVVFMFDPAADTGDKDDVPPVSQVAIQALDARAFALRAENRLHGPYEKNTRDLKTAISIDPEFTHARWLLADIYLATGQADLAEAEAAAALEVEPTNAALQLRHGQALLLLGKYDDAVHAVRGVLDREDASPVVRAQAMHEMARLASFGDAEIAAKAISFDTRAIEIADQLATSDSVKERRAAKRLLVEAHLSIAEEISRQSFAGKIDSLSRWVGRASGLAEDYIENEGGSVELRLLVSQRALAAMASFKPTLDPAPWVAEAEEAANALRKEWDDELWQQRIAWELGQVYLHALRTDHLRRETATALKYGQQAIENLAEGASGRQAVHSAEQNVGQLYFHVGAVYAVHQQDHTKAVAWYEKAAPLLAGARPNSELYSPRRDGEMLVSMGVSYWQTGDQNRALELTEAGAKLVEAAVEDGILAKSSLAVPYGNLATMYQQAGQNASATKYANMAKAVGGSGTDAKSAPQTSRATASQPNRTGMMQTGGQQGRAVAPRR